MKEIFIKETNTMVRIDSDNNVLLAFDVKNEIVDDFSEGILTEVSPFMFEKIKVGLNINPNDFGVECVDR